MKKRLTAVILALTAALTAPSAAAAEVRTPPVGVYAVVTDDAGSRQVSGAPAVSGTEDAQAYTLYVDQREALRVGASGDADKRYHVTFMLPDTSDEVYLTGLCAEDVEELQQAILANYTEGQPFDFNDLHFIDAEKLQSGKKDSELCWAACCANLLVYTGWAQRAGFADEDEVFDLYANAYSNSGGFQRDGLAWFFNGVALGKNNGLFSPKILNYPNSGKYFNNYAYDMLCNYEYIRSVAQLNHMEERLRSGCGISLGVGILKGNGGNGSHATTLWGVVTDTARDRNDLSRFRQVFITDSDTDMTETADRSLSENVMHMRPVYANEKEQLCFDYDDQMTAVLEDFTYLLPYDKSLPRERDLATMRDKTKFPDLCFGRVTLSAKRYEVEQEALYESGTKVYLGLDADNASDKDYRADVSVSRRIVNEKGEVILDDTVTLAERRLALAEETSMHYATLEKLPAGDYHITLKLNEARPVAEAYYYNNTCTLGFRMRDSYRLGDCNGDGKLDVADVTEIQRLLAELYEDDKAVERGNVDEAAFDIHDATLLQAYLAAYEINAPVGAKRLYTSI